VTQPTSTDDRPPPHRGNGHRARDRTRQAIALARRRFEGSWLQDLGARLKAVDFGNSIVLFAAALLLSMLPLIILLSSIANERIDDDLSRHIGLNRQGAHIIESLFRKSPTHAAGPIILGLIVAFAGTVTVASFLQGIYERVFDQEHRGWRDLPRFLVWVCVLFGFLIAEGSIDNPIRSAVGSVVRGLVSFVGVTIFFWWTMHFLLARRVRWRYLLRPAFASALFWLGFALFSSIYFSSALISEHKLYGTIGVVFILMTWFIAIGAVIVLGAACGAVWQERAVRRAQGAMPTTAPRSIDDGSDSESTRPKR
jgi:membrane protein